LIIVGSSPTLQQGPSWPGSQACPPSPPLQYQAMAARRRRRRLRQAATTAAPPPSCRRRAAALALSSRHVAWAWIWGSGCGKILFYYFSRNELFQKRRLSVLSFCSRPNPYVRFCLNQSYAINLFVLYGRSPSMMDAVSDTICDSGRAIRRKQGK
jgi:hypothetical protein